MSRQDQTRNTPTTNEKAALRGTRGTPSAANRFVTSNDTRLSSVAIHGSSHAAGGADVVEFYPVLTVDPTDAATSPFVDCVWFIRNGTSPETVSLRACIDGVIGTLQTWSAP